MAPAPVSHIIKAVKLQALVVAAVLLTACNRASQSPEAVKQGVLNHLSKTAGLNVGSMAVDVSSVTFRDNEADALVSIRPKNSTDPANAMSMKYTLERKGGEWVVKGRSGGGGNPHGGAMPSGGGGGGSQLPPGHPPAASK
jgi:uncharacterized membrane protein YgcG